MSVFMSGTPRRHEVAGMAALNTVVVIGAGHLAQRQSAGTLLVGASCGLATYIVGSRLTGMPVPKPRISNAARLGCAIVLCLVAAATLGAIVGASWMLGHRMPQPEHQRYVQPTPRTIQLQPCPSGELITRRPDGTFVCYVTVPPDPGGPVIASPPA